MQLAYDSSKATQDQPADEVKFSQASGEQVAVVWPAIVDMVERGLSHGQGDATTPQALLYQILNNEYQLWVAHKGDDIYAGIILSVTQHVNGRKVFIHMAAGRNMDLWIDQLENLLRDFMGVTGSMCIEASCRHGLAKRLHARGWRKKAVIMELT
jgi:hypothetical protein